MKKNLLTLASISFLVLACQFSTPTPLPTETPVAWQTNPDKTLNPPPDEREAIEKAYKAALTGFLVLEDIGNDPMKYPPADEKGKIEEGIPAWNMTGRQNSWFVGEYKSFDVRCFNEQTCEVAFTIHITGMIVGSENCLEAQLETAPNGNCWYDPEISKSIWENTLKKSRDWYDRGLMVKIDNQWYLGGYSPFPLNSATPTPWSPQTQESILQPTVATTLTEQPVSVKPLPDYFFLDDAYNPIIHEDGGAEFYTYKSFEEIHDYYINELPLHGYSEVVVERYAQEGCSETFFSGDPTGKMLVVTSCVIFQTEEHWVSIGLIDK